MSKDYKVTLDYPIGNHKDKESARQYFIDMIKNDSFRRYLMLEAWINIEES